MAEPPDDQIMSRQTIVLQEGQGPSKILVLHADGEVTRIEVTVSYREGIKMAINLAEGHQIAVEGLPDG